MSRDWLTQRRFASPPAPKAHSAKSPPFYASPGILRLLSSILALILPKTGQSPAHHQPCTHEHLAMDDGWWVCTECGCRWWSLG